MTFSAIRVGFYMETRLIADSNDQQGVMAAAAQPMGGVGPQTRVRRMNRPPPNFFFSFFSSRPGPLPPLPTTTIFFFGLPHLRLTRGPHTNRLALFRVAATSQDVANEVAAHRRVLRAELLGHLRRQTAEAGGEEAGGNGKQLDAVVVQEAVPLAHHHVETRLAGAVSRVTAELFWPAGARPRVDALEDHLVHALRLHEGGRARGDEEEAGVGRLEQEGRKRLRHDVVARHVDVPRLVPYLAYGQGAVARGGVDVDARVVDQRVDFAVLRRDRLEGGLDGGVRLNVDFEHLQGGSRVGHL